MTQTCAGKNFRDSLHAGTWYPGSEQELKNAIKDYLDGARARDHGQVRALIAPHAGYVYSGPVAGFSYRAVINKEYDLVIVIGPSHRHGFEGASVDMAAGRRTPLGNVPFDLDRAKKLRKECRVVTYDAMAHSQEHSTEIQMPFLQVVLKKFKALEIVMGTQDWETCAALADGIVAIARGQKVLVVASSDLSHYHRQAEAEALDKHVIKAVRDFDPGLLSRELSEDSCEACGGGPIITAMLAAKKMGADGAEILAYATSAETSGDRTQVVGYLAACLYEKGAGADSEKVGVELGFTEEEKAQLKKIATRTIEAVVRSKDVPEFEAFTGRLNEPFGVFVTITKAGNLRGCIGHIVADQPLYRITSEMAKAAAQCDPRFDPLTVEELDEIEIEISVLTPFEPVTDFKEIVIGRDGLIVRRGYCTGLLLPQVATDYGWTVEEFLEHTCNKAGLPKKAYREKGTEIFKFSAQVF